ncbi:hypothetical protein ABPG72_004981 [Tetrahymena utriculariae]
MKQFIQIVNQNKQDFQIFMEMKHKVQLSNEMTIIKRNCIICNAKNHPFIECLQTHLPKHPQFTIFKHTYFPNQERDQNYKRIENKHDRCIIVNLSEQKQNESEFKEDLSSIEQQANNQEYSNNKDSKLLTCEVNINKRQSQIQDSLRNIQEQMQGDHTQKDIKSQVNILKQQIMRYMIKKIIMKIKIVTKVLLT